MKLPKQRILRNEKEEKKKGKGCFQVLALKDVFRFGQVEEPH